MTPTLAAPLMVRWPFHCLACRRRWCVFAVRFRVIEIQGCPFCGVRRWERGDGVVLAMRELRGGVR